jgi:hypothetical protein
MHFEAKNCLKVAYNGLRYEHVAGFGAIHYQNTPKLDAGLKAKQSYKPRHCL